MYPPPGGPAPTSGVPPLRCAPPRPPPPPPPPRPAWPSRPAPTRATPPGRAASPRAAPSPPLPCAAGAAPARPGTSWHGPHPGEQGMGAKGGVCIHVGGGWWGKGGRAAGSKCQQTHNRKQHAPACSPCSPAPAHSVAPGSPAQHGCPGSSPAWPADAPPPAPWPWRRAPAPRPAPEGWGMSGGREGGGKRGMRRMRRITSVTFQHLTRHFALLQRLPYPVPNFPALVRYPYPPARVRPAAGCRPQWPGPPPLLPPWPASCAPPAQRCRRTPPP